MILSSIALVTMTSFGALPQGGQAETQSAGELVSKMFSYYNDAKSLAGTINFTQAFQGRQVKIDTRMQYEWPAKVYISQQYTGQSRRDRWLVTGDGVGFSYDEPRVLASKNQNNRLYEPVQFIPPPPKYKTDVQLPMPPPHDVRTIYRAVCLTIGDRSLPLDIAFGRKEDLAYIRQQLKTLNYRGQQDLNGTNVHVVYGVWRDSPGNEVSEDNGEYELYLTSDGQLKRFARREVVDFRDEKGRPIANGPIVTIWDVNLTKNSGVDPKLFKVVLRY